MTASLLDIHPLPAAARERSPLALDYARVRGHSLALAAPLSAEDQCVQSMPDASPTKWHLAHTSWFFEAFVLQPHAPGYRAFDPRFGHLFNSYYEALGPRHERPRRGLLTRPSHADVLAYRRHVDDAMHTLMAAGAMESQPALQTLVGLGLQHEQQHQELLLTDILHAFWCNPLLPAYEAVEPPTLRLAQPREPIRWLAHAGGIEHVGHDGEGFAFDNETPRHAVLLQPFEIADRLVTCGEYAAFIADGGYQRASLWLSDGWALVQQQGWQAPAYWLHGDDPRLGPGRDAGMWHVFGLGGAHPMDPLTPVTQLSLYEAAAYAEWAGARLPTEFEWEAACRAHGMRLRQQTGHAWQWTRSSYDPYPGFRALPGAVGEYNGKFMVGQVVLRGGSLATPEGHARPTYRNFFPPAARWQFSGLRLARDSTSC
ncbi:MAG: ergothioneine biosynthesis protein EgtB [Burkholderiaceae bacterium]|nr:ergothioneine biosynthesis protein EgtB [Burkholderiaceae bacterium]